MTMDTIFVGSETGRRNALQATPRNAWRALRGWYIKRRTRHRLAELTDDQLHDIGVTRSQARREIAKSFYWDANA